MMSQGEGNKTKPSIPEKLGIHEDDFRLIIGRTKIEFDPDKEDANRNKHGYSLESAVHLIEKCLFFQPDPFFVYGPFECRGEKRFKWLGLDDAKTVVHVVCTMRPDETVRVISFRRASQQDRDLFQALVDKNQNPNEEGES